MDSTIDGLSTELLQKDAQIKAILADFMQVLTHYQQHNTHWLYGSLLDMEQQVTTGDITRSASLKTGSVSIAATCSLKPSTVTLTHTFESTRYVPIPNTAYQLVKRPLSALSHYGLSNDGSTGYSYTTQGYGASAWKQPYSGTPVPDGSGQFDENGVAKITVPPCEPGYEYVLIMNPHIQPADMQALNAAYSGVIQRYHAWLEKKWHTEQRAAWQEYLEQGGLSMTKIAQEFLNGILEQLKTLYDTVKQVGKWILNIDKYAAQLASYLSDDGIAKLKAMGKAGAQKLGETLTLLSDEMMIFILGYAAYSYIRMLTPQQIADALANMVGSILTMVVLYFALPGMGAFILDKLDTLSDIVPSGI